MRALLMPAFTLAASVASASGVISFSNYLYAANDGRDLTLGFGFWADSAFEVGGLGVFDHLADGLSEDHAVALWDSTDGTMVANTIVPAGTASFVEDFYRYQQIDPVTLTTGHFYVVGAFYRALSPDKWTFGITLDDYSDFQTSPEITFYRGLYHYDSFAIPDTQTNAFYGGGNVFIGGVPEPVSLTILGIGFLAATRRRCKLPDRGR